MSKSKFNPYHSAHLPNLSNPNSTTNHLSTTASLPPPPLTPTSPTLTTTVYKTDLGLFSLTWSRNTLARSLHIHLLHHNPAAATLSPSSLSSPAFHLHLRPFIFWNKTGSKNLKFTKPMNAQIYWDLSRAKFGTRPEPQSGYSIAVVVDGQLTLLAGDSPTEALSKTKPSQTMVSRREHVLGNTLYTTEATFGGKTRTISIDCREGEGQRLGFWIDQNRVLQIKHLKWKFRGNERIEVDGVYVQVSWDVYNWLFEDGEDGYALFMFRFEKQGIELGMEDGDEMVWWSQECCGFGFGFEKKKMEMKKKRKKGLLKSSKSLSSSSSSSMSSVSSSSSVREWASVEENELKGPCDFSLLVYAWKS